MTEFSENIIDPILILEDFVKKKLNFKALFSLVPLSEIEWLYHFNVWHSGAGKLQN